MPVDLAPYTILLCVDPPTIRDQVRCGLKLFQGLRAVDATRDQVTRVLESGEDVDALILSHGSTMADLKDSFLEKVRAKNKKVAILVLGDLPNRQHFTKTKVELDILSFVPVPLDSFDLARRLHRLLDHLQKKR